MTVKVKSCGACGNTLPLEVFPFRADAKDKTRNECIPCYKVKHRNMYAKRAETRRVECLAYYDNNKEKVLAQKREYFLVNRNKIIQGIIARRHTNVQAKLTHYLRSRISKALKRGKKSGSVIKNVGCSLEFLKKYIESKFQPGMTWDNWSTTGWHLDHMKPLSSFDLTDRTQFLTAVHFSNLQPLWAKDNLSKGKRVA